MLVVLETYVAELNLVFEAAYVYRLHRFPDVVLCKENLVDTLHRGKPLGNVVPSLGEVFQWLYDRVEDDEIIDECRGLYCLVVEYKYTTEPQYDNNHYRAEELAHWVCHLLPYVHPFYMVAVFAVDAVEA